MFENNRGNVPIPLFGSPFSVIGTETRHCLHGSTKVIHNISDYDVLSSCIYDGRGGYNPKSTGAHDYASKKRIQLQNRYKTNTTLASIAQRD